MTHVQVRRIYDAPTREDGVRVLVDRIWPRGMSKAKAQLDEWCKGHCCVSAKRTRRVPHRGVGRVCEPNESTDYGPHESPI
jgi:uncharacterized protein YeaO (DUF488 family)